MRRHRFGACVLAYVVFSAIGVWGPGASPAMAHQSDRAEYIAEVRPEAGEVEVLLRVAIGDLVHHLGYVGHGEEITDQALGQARDEIAEYFDGRSGVLADDAPCERKASEFIAYPGMDGRVHYYQHWECEPMPKEIKMVNRVLIDSHGGYRHEGTVQMGDDIRRTVFDPNYPTYSVYPGGGEERAEQGDRRRVPQSKEEEGDLAAGGSDEMPKTSFFGGIWGWALALSVLLVVVAIGAAVRKLWSAQTAKTTR